MSTRTLEEIAAQYSKGRGDGAPHMAPLGVMIENFPRLLAIAQEQRGAMAADEDRARAAAMRVWGEHVRGCDTADAMADLIVRQRAEIARLQDNASTAAFDKIADQLGEANRENEEQRAELSAVFAAIDEVDAACEDQAYGWSERKDAARKNLQLLRNKHKIGTKR